MRGFDTGGKLASQTLHEHLSLSIDALEIAQNLRRRMLRELSDGTPAACLPFSSASSCIAKPSCCK